MLKVYCDLSDPVNPKTRVNHNVEWKLEVNNFDARYGYHIQVTYDPPVTYDQFAVLVVGRIELLAFYMFLNPGQYGFLPPRIQISITHLLSNVHIHIISIKIWKQYLALKSNQKVQAQHVLCCKPFLSITILCELLTGKRSQ